MADTESGAGECLWRPWCTEDCRGVYIFNPPVQEQDNENTE
jgi:hypothetical protein